MHIFYKITLKNRCQILNEKFIQNTCVYLKLFSVKNFNNSI